MSIWHRMLSGVLASLLGFSGQAATVASTADDKKTAAVDEVFADLATPGSPGCALGVYRDGKIIYTKGYGLANLEENVPITPQSVFDIGSTSKQFTAASILLLEKQGKLSVNDDVRKYIPELPDYGPKITILHLLNHTSGLRDYLTLMELAGINTDSVTTDEDALQIVARQRALNFAPGSDWLYSNTGFFLLSAIVKRVSSQTLREFAAENIFTPLGMVHTQFRDDHASLIANRALAYDPKERGGFTLDVSYFEQTGDGAVHTSVEDLQKWDENFFTAQIGGKEFLVEIQQQGKLTAGKVLDYARGLFLQDYRGLPTVRHGGSWGGYRAELLRFPQQHFSVACLCNLGTARPGERAERVSDIYLGSLMKPKEEKKQAQNKPENEVKPSLKLTAEQLSPYVGDYWSTELGVAYRMGIADGSLKVLALLDRAGTLRTSRLPFRQFFSATSADEFAMEKTPIAIHFQRDSNQLVKGFTLDAGRTRGMTFSRREVPAK